MKRRTLACWLVSAALAFSPLAALSDQPDEPDADAPRKPIRERFGFNYTMGYGHGIHMRERTQGKDVGDTQMLLFMPHVRFELADWTERDHWYAGRLDLVVEPELAINFEPTTGVGGGVTGGFRYRLWADHRWSPYFIGVMGFGTLNFDLVHQADGFNFWLNAGFGVRRALSHERALTADVRLYHISNARTSLPNEGIDAIAFTLGFEYR